MRKVLTVVAVLLSMVSFSQTYVNGLFSYYDGTGTFGQKSMGTVEVGRTWDVLSVGVAGGVTSFTGGNAYLEVRPSVTVFQKDRVSVSATLGAGYVFDSPTNLLVEVSGSGNLSLNKNWSLSLFAGKYRFNGKRVATTATFVGTGVTYIFK